MPSVEEIISDDNQVYFMPYSSSHHQADHSTRTPFKFHYLLVSVPVLCWGVIFRRKFVEISILSSVLFRVIRDFQFQIRTCVLQGFSFQ